MRLFHVISRRYFKYFSCSLINSIYVAFLFADSENSVRVCYSTEILDLSLNALILYSEIFSKRESKRISAFNV